MAEPERLNTQHDLGTLFREVYLLQHKHHFVRRPTTERMFDNINMCMVVDAKCITCGADGIETISALDTVLKRRGHFKIL